MSDAMTAAPTTADPVGTRRASPWTRPGARTLGLIAVLAIVVFVPPYLFSSSTLLTWSNAGVYALLALGLCATFSYTGQLSLAQGILGPVAGYTVGVMSTREHLSLVVALVLGVVASTIVAGILTPLLRLRGFYFAVATILGALVVTTVIPNQFGSLTGYYNGLTLTDLSVGSQSFFDPVFRYNVVWVLVALSILFYRNLERSRVVRSARVVKASPLIAQSLGLRGMVVKAQFFIVSGVFTGLGSVLLVGSVGSIAPDTFDFSLSVAIFVGVIVGGRRGVWGAVIGAVFVTLVNQALSSVVDASSLIYGLVLALCVGLLPGGLSTLVSELVRRYLRSRARSDSPPDAVVDPAGAATDGPGELSDARAAGLRPLDVVRAASGPELALHDVRLGYGGLQVLQGVSLELYPGEILGLIGANGAGKSTLLNVISGYSAPDAGTMTVAGTDMTGSRPWQLRRAGVVRAFQVPQVFSDLTVWENIALGLDVGKNHGVLRSGLRTPSVLRSEREVAERAGELARSVGLAGKENRRGSELSLGQRRLVELARCLASEARILLLDEPFAGLSIAMIYEIQTTLVRLAASGCSVLLIDHNISEVARIAQEAAYLRSGRIEVRGTIADLMADEAISHSYAGI